MAGGMAGSTGRAAGVVRVIRHRPERDLAMLAPLACGCCCCCCCLHSVGGLVGAVVASSKANRPGEPPTLGQVNGSRTYWLALVLTLAAWSVGSLVLEGGTAAIGGLILGLPLIQLPAGLLAVLLCLREQDRQERGRAQRRVGRIVVGGLLGTIAGTLLMCLIFVLIK